LWKSTVCLIALNFCPGSDAPILLAANREEAFDRLALPPHVQPGRPRVICGIDKVAGGTWLGVNEFGLLVAVTNRPKSRLRAGLRSRGLLCRELLNCSTARDAIDHATSELASGRYAGANVLAVSDQGAAVIHAGDQLQAQHLESGLHLLANGDLNDLTDKRLHRARCAFSDNADSVDDFLEAAAAICSLADGESPIVLRMDGRGTVSSSLIALTRDQQQSRYLHAEGPPDSVPYVDHSVTMRDVFRARSAGE
jgi:uncharacterized protein with NRDE domain